MNFLPPFVLHAANHIEASRVQAHIDAYPLLLTALRDDRFDFSAAHTHRALSVDISSA